jgi:hypothetical protein
MDRFQLLKQLDKAWVAFKESYVGLSDLQLTEPGVTGHWSVKDILAHVTTWEAEALKHLPAIIEGGRPPKYSTQYGGIDAFNARMTEQKRNLSLTDVLGQLDETHRRLIDYVQRAPAEQFTWETRFRRRLRLDTYSHYPKHAKAIREWRERPAGSGSLTAGIPVAPALDSADESRKTHPPTGLHVATSRHAGDRS